MNREIKFRGKNLNGDWVYGNLSNLKSKHKSIEPGFYVSNSAGLPFAYHVRPETVGQFTGLKDKNGIDIYEGDEIFYKNCEESGKGYIEFQLGFVIVWTEHKTQTPSMLSPLYYFGCSAEIEILSNIHEPIKP